jgi:biphenyl-2,3-diol 1,2-dioxygenase
MTGQPDRGSDVRADLQLGYLILGASDPERLNYLFQNVLGLLPEDLTEGRTGYRMDDWERRFVLEPGADGLHAIGLVARDRTTFASLRNHLNDRAVTVTQGAAEDCRLRAVREFVSFADPSGNVVELSYGPTQAINNTFISALVPGGFLTGDQGLGHVVLLSDDRKRDVEFYQHALGFRISDTSGQSPDDDDARAVFLHCNRRHHTIAVVQRSPETPKSVRLGHFMIQARDMDAVGLAYDRAIDAGMPIFRSLGRHPNDNMFSFYGRTPAGFDIEFGSGAVEIGDNWQVRHYQTISTWGHRPGPGMV